jgi:hypothetical protein
MKPSFSNASYGRKDLSGLPEGTIKPLVLWQVKKRRLDFTLDYLAMFRS